MFTQQEKYPSPYKILLSLILISATLEEDLNLIRLNHFFKVKLVLLDFKAIFYAIVKNNYTKNVLINLFN